jgi:primosomal protein N' (replication factor Y)
MIEIGSRVSVPFGNRLLQGFVVGMSQVATYTSASYKAIEQVLDLKPPLNRELVHVAEWLSHTYICKRIVALQAMVPAALKAKYERGLFLLSEDVPPGLDEVGLQIWNLIRHKEGISKERLLMEVDEAAYYLKQWMKQGLLEERQAIKHRTQVKKQLFVKPTVNQHDLFAAIEDLPKNASQQKKIAHYFLTNPEPIALADLLSALGGTSATVRALEERQLVSVFEQEVGRDPYANRTFKASQAMKMTDEQQVACDTITQAISMEQSETFLLRGVTGSGKTEVYLQAIEHCLQLGKQAIVLVPEISLTPQMVERFKSRFGDLVAVLHSRLSAGERLDEWRKIVNNQVKVAIGARSAVFAPFEQLGLIIIDEEHETSYKQEESPKYHARDVAIERARHHQATVVLGTATPSLESYAAVQDRTFTLLEMDQRVFKQEMPSVEIVDMREELAAGNRSMFSRPLHQAIEDRLTKREQSILLLNRRGHSTFVMCRSCGYTVLCPHCEIAMTYHRQTQLLRCHYCGHADREPKQCPSCSSAHIRYFGTGTQRVEEQLMQQFPGIRVIRMDVDTTSTKGAHEQLLTRFRNKEADVLLGTQMVAKGLDFPDVTLVGVIAADTVLHLPDFRASERTFQLLTQVAGRAGRHTLPGEVVIQTYHPEHYSLTFAKNHDFNGFAEKELDLRAKLNYPPYCKLILVTFSHVRSPIAMQAAQQFIDVFRTQLGGEPITILGPVAAPIAKIKDRYRIQCLIKYRDELTVLNGVQEAWLEIEKKTESIDLSIQIDVDPQLLL